MCAFRGQKHKARATASKNDSGPQAVDNRICIHCPIGRGGCLEGKTALPFLRVASATGATEIALLSQKRLPMAGRGLRSRARGLTGNLATTRVDFPRRIRGSPRGHTWRQWLAGGNLQGSTLLEKIPFGNAFSASPQFHISCHHVNK